MKQKTIYLAGGCFWGTQKFFDQFDGVLETEVGYANGPTEKPSYKQVCASSGHAETVRIVYDAEKITLDQLLDWYFLTIDPTSYHRQGGIRASSTARASTTSTRRICPNCRRAMPPSRKNTARSWRWNCSRWRTSIPRRNTTRSIWTKTPAATATFHRSCCTWGSDSRHAWRCKAYSLSSWREGQGPPLPCDDDSV